MRLFIRPILHPPITSLPGRIPHHKPLSKILSSKSVLQVRNFTPTEPKTVWSNKPFMLATLDQLLAKEPFSKANALEGLKLLTSISDSDLLSLQPLLKVNGGRWDLSSDRGLGMRRIFKFKGFKDAWNFMNAIAAKCKEEKHHPEWVNVYNTVFIRWTTHDLPGLTSKDIRMATFCDEEATMHKEIVGAPQEVVNEVTEYEELHKFARYADIASEFEKMKPDHVRAEEENAHGEEVGGEKLIKST